MLFDSLFLFLFFQCDLSLNFKKFFIGFCEFGTGSCHFHLALDVSLLLAFEFLFDLLLDQLTLELVLL